MLAYRVAELWGLLPSSTYVYRCYFSVDVSEPSTATQSCCCCCCRCCGLQHPVWAFSDERINFFSEANTFDHPPPIRKPRWRAQLLSLCYGWKGQAHGYARKGVREMAGGEREEHVFMRWGLSSKKEEPHAEKGLHRSYNNNA